MHSLPDRKKIMLIIQLVYVYVTQVMQGYSTVVRTTDYMQNYRLH